MRKLFLLLLVAVMLLQACTAVKEDENTNAYAEQAGELTVQEIDLVPEIIISPVLYFLNESQTKLQAETREIRVPAYRLREDYVIRALIEGPVSENLRPVMDGMGLEYLEIMPDMLNVYLTRESYIREEDIMNAKLAVATTLVEFTGKKYVNIFINGVQTGYRSSEPTGALTNLGNDLSEEKLSLRGKSQSDNPDMQTALYFLDSSEKFLLPEVRRLVFRDNEYVRTIVDQMIGGPSDTVDHRSSLDSSLRLLDYEFTFDENRQQVLNLKFNKEPVVYTDEFVDGQEMALAALTYTLTGFIPELYGITYQIGEVPGNGKVYTAEQYRPLIGSDILVYLPNGSTSTLLIGVERIIRQDMSTDPGVVLSELMKGPSAYDRSDAYPAMPAGITYEDVDDIYIAGDMMVVNLDNAVDAKMMAVTQENEFTMIFSIANTLTNFEGIRSVQFLVEGERVEYLGEGWICLIDPIIKNPGIIRY